MIFPIQGQRPTMQTRQVPQEDTRTYTLFRNQSLILTLPDGEVVRITLVSTGLTYTRIGVAAKHHIPIRRGETL